MTAESPTSQEPHEPLIPIDEIEALLRYAAENSGEHPDPERADAAFTARLLNQVGSKESNEDKAGAVEAVIAVYAKLQEERKAQGPIVPELYEALESYKAAQRSERVARYKRVLDLYGQLTRLTAPVTGHSILETREVSRRKLGRVLAVTVTLLVLGLGLQILEHWLTDSLSPEYGWLYWLSANTQILAHVSPYVWGAVGACIYLLKYLYDIAQIQAFDSRRFTGFGLRIGLGAVLGGIVVEVFTTTGLGADGEGLERDVFAFLAGLGMRVVYGALEKTIQVLSDKLNLESVRTSQVKGREPPAAAKGDGA